jgi:hypothetical protein
MRVVILLLTACAACVGGSRAEPTQHLPRPAGPTDPSLTLFVSNQSFARDRVDIEIRLDGQLAVTGDFDVEGQHTWIDFDVAIAPGEHAISIVSQDGDATREQSFVMDARKYGVVMYWYDEGDNRQSGPDYSFDLSDDAPAFE